MDKYKKLIGAITSKRKKTDADYAEIARLEFIAGLYFDKDKGPIVPSRCIRKMLIEAARKDKNGKQFESGVFVAGDSVLEYDGPREIEPLFLAENGDGENRFVWTTVVGNQRNSIMRTRPIFHEWSCEFEVDLEPSLVDQQTFETALEKARVSGGLLDARSIGYGKFSPTVL